MKPTRILAAALALAAAAWAVLQVPVDVPDTSSPPYTTASATANDRTSVGQSFVPSRNGLDRVSVVLGTDRPTDAAEVVFRLADSPGGEPLRTVRQPISALPAGNPSDFRPHMPAERWYSFEFEPLWDSAGRTLYFSIDGKGVPQENTVRVLVHFHNWYPRGQAYLSGEPTNANVLFRAHSRGRLPDLLEVLGENLARDKPRFLTTPVPYLAAALAYGLLTAAVLVSLRRSA